MDYNQRLLNAAENGEVEQLKDAIEHGADLETREWNDRTAVMLAVWDEYTECLALLIEAGVNLEARDDQGKTVAILVAWRGKGECLRLLIEAGADLGVRDNSGWTAAMWAASRDHTGCLALLINAGIDPIKEILGGRTLLEIAQDEGWEDVISAWEDQLMQKKVGQRTSREEGDSFGL